MKTATRLTLLPVLLLGLSGCLDFEQGLELNRDLSGKATIHVTIDMDSMVPLVAKLQREMQGQEGEPTEEELAAVRKELLEKQTESKADEEQEFAARRARIEQSLPEGVTLGETVMETDGLKQTMRFTFAFDHVSKLPQIEIPEDPADPAAGEMGEPPPGGPNEEAMKRPFEGLTVEETAEQVRITFRPANPAKDEPEAGESGEEDAGPEGEPFKKLGEAVKSSLRIGITIRSPLAVVEQNAAKQEGEVLTWSWRGDGIKTLDDASIAPPTVVFRKAQ